MCFYRGGGGGGGSCLSVRYKCTAEMVNIALRIQPMIVPIYDPTMGINEKPNEKISSTTITITIKIITSPMLLATKLKVLLMLSMMSVPSIMVTTTINIAIGSRIIVMPNMAAIMATTINTPILLIT